MDASNASPIGSCLAIMCDTIQHILNGCDTGRLDPKLRYRASPTENWILGGLAEFS